MKLYIISLLTALCGFSASAQSITSPVQRNIEINIIGEDSVKLSLDHNFTLIEDSCSEITRFAHLTSQQQFRGKFKDVNSANPAILITSGTYNDEGLKEGPFIINYINGAPHARGNFKANAFDGKWETFYEDGKPKLTFEAKGNDIKIIDAWDMKGVKTIDNGTGILLADIGFGYWKGKLVNAKPEGTWKLISASDETELNTERFKKGVFQGGSSAYGDYDISRLQLVSIELLDFVTAEKFEVSRDVCGSVGIGNIVQAHYGKNEPSAAERVADVVYNYLRAHSDELNLGMMVISGEIDATGKIQKLHSINSAFSNLSLGGKLYTLPRFIPATIDKKPVAQKFNIIIKITRVQYDVRFQLLPIEHN